MIPAPTSNPTKRATTRIHFITRRRLIGRGFF
jgi:hypothetical protein